VAREEVEIKRGKRWRSHVNKSGNANDDDAWSRRITDGTSHLHHLEIVVAVKAKLQRCMTLLR
jgi:hypothetical protein